MRDLRLFLRRIRLRIFFSLAFRYCSILVALAIGVGVITGILTGKNRIVLWLAPLGAVVGVYLAFKRTPDYPTTAGFADETLGTHAILSSYLSSSGSKLEAELRTRSREILSTRRPVDVMPIRTPPESGWLLLSCALWLLLWLYPQARTGEETPLPPEKAEKAPPSSAETSSRTATTSTPSSPGSILAPDFVRSLLSRYNQLVRRFSASPIEQLTPNDVAGLRALSRALKSEENKFARGLQRAIRERNKEQIARLLAELNAQIAKLRNLQPSPSASGGGATGISASPQAGFSGESPTASIERTKPAEIPLSTPSPVGTEQIPPQYREIVERYFDGLEEFVRQTQDASGRAE